MPDIDVAIINWNTATEAIEAARAYAHSEGVDVRVTVFDNDSGFEEKLRLRSVDEFASLIENAENLGFGRAANEVLSRGDAEYVLVSNADVVPEATAVAGMIEAFESRPNAGLVGPVLKGTSGYHDRLPGPATLIVRTVIGNFNRKVIPTPGRGAIVEVDQPAGACLLTSRRVWEEVGGFDEDFFLWYEDVDLAKRVSDLGYSNLIAGGARVSHIGGRSFSSVDADAMDVRRIQSLQLYAKRHHPKTGRLIKFISPAALATRRSTRHLLHRLRKQERRGQR